MNPIKKMYSKITKNFNKEPTQEELDVMLSELEEDLEDGDLDEPSDEDLELLFKED